MNTNYSYEINSVDEASRSMVVTYSSAGRDPITMGTRLPLVGESLEAVIEQFSPMQFWLMREVEVEVPTVGTIGEFVAPQPADPAPVTLESSKIDKKKEIADWRWRREVGGVNVGGTRILTDRESQAQITSAYTSLANNLVASVDFKTADGTWVALGLLEVSAVAQAVAAHVQQSFSLEKQLGQMVDAAETIEQVQAIEPEVVYVV